jgi:hypothetical protein
MPVPPLGPFSSEDVEGILSEHGFTSNPAGLITHYRGDLTFESDSLAYLDINAIAVRRGNIVPDRPIRITFRYETNGRLPNGNYCPSWNWRPVCRQGLWTGSRTSQKSHRGGAAGRSSQGATVSKTCKSC